MFFKFSIKPFGRVPCTTSFQRPDYKETSEEQLREKSRVIYGTASGETSTEDVQESSTPKKMRISIDVEKNSVEITFN